MDQEPRRPKFSLQARSLWWYLRRRQEGQFDIGSLPIAFASIVGEFLDAGRATLEGTILRIRAVAHEWRCSGGNYRQCTWCGHTLPKDPVRVCPACGAELRWPTD